MNIGKEIKTIRKENKINSLDIVKNADVSRSKLSRIENGVGNFPYEDVMRIIDALGYRIVLVKKDDEVFIKKGV